MVAHSTQLLLANLSKEIDAGKYKEMPHQHKHEIQSSIVKEPTVDKMEMKEEKPVIKQEEVSSGAFDASAKQVKKEMKAPEAPKSSKADPKAFAQGLLAKKASALNERLSGAIKNKFAAKKEEK
jgi:hypothetical protein